MATAKKEPFGGKKAVPFGKKGEDKEKAKKATAKKTAARKK